MRPHTAIFTLAALTIVTASSALAQNSYPTSAGADNYTQAQAAPIQRTAPPANADPRVSYANTGQAANSEQYPGDQNQGYTDQGQANGNPPPDASGQTGY